MRLQSVGVVGINAFEDNGNGSEGGHSFCQQIRSCSASNGVRLGIKTGVRLGLRTGSGWGSGRGQTGAQDGVRLGLRTGSDWGSGQGSEWDIHNVRLAGTHVGPLRTANTW